MSIGTRILVGTGTRAVMSGFIAGLAIPKPIQYFLRMADLCFWIGRRLHTLEAMEAHPHLALIGMYLHEQFRKNDFMLVAARIILVARVLNDLGKDIEDFTGRLELTKESFRPAPLGRVCFADELNGRDWRRVEEEVPRFVQWHWLAVRIGERCKKVCKRFGSTVIATVKIAHRILELRESIFNSAPPNVLEMMPIAVLQLAQSFVGREEDMIAQVRSNEQAINRILAITNPSWTADRLVRVIERFATGAQVIHAVLNAPAQIGEQIALGLEDE